MNETVTPNLHHNSYAKKPIWLDVVFYATLSLFFVAAATYGFLLSKVYLQERQLRQITAIAGAYGTQEQREAEEKFLAYKKKIDDFSALVNNQRITSNIFNFIESHTLPKVWFTSFDMSGSKDSIRLSGIAESMELLGRQVQLLEDSKKEINSVSIFGSQTDGAGNTTFVLALSLNPDIFKYQSIASGSDIIP